MPPTQANFVWVPMGDDTLDWASGCADRKVIVRPFAEHGARVTIGTPEETTGSSLPPATSPPDAPRSPGLPAGDVSPAHNQVATSLAGRGSCPQPGPPLAPVEHAPRDVSANVTPGRQPA